MKNTILILTLLLFAFSGKSQVQNNVVNQMDSVKYKGQTEQYCLLICQARFMSTKVNVDIDFGQTTTYWSAARQRSITDETGKLKKFESVIDALHFLNSKGWQFVAAYPMSSSQGSCYHYLMKRPILKEDLAGQ